VATSGGVTVGGANVVTADVEASNGVIHVIDQVLLPEGLEVGGEEEQAAPATVMDAINRTPELAQLGICAPLTIVVDGDTVTVNGATVTTADIEAGNGVIHIIDTVLTPPAA
jgi:uncharacterized surface protein with fasciclin (FAS1) repeats